MRWITGLATGAAATALTLTGLVAAAPAASASLFNPTVSVGGTVGSPATYTMAQLAALPQVTEQWPSPPERFLPAQTETGVTLESLVDLSAPVLPATKNSLLEAVVTVQGLAGQRVTFALGEMDASFGNHDPLLSLRQDGYGVIGGPLLVVPGDTGVLRTVLAVSKITVAVEAPAPTTPAAGALDIEYGGSTVELSAQALAALPAQQLTVSFLAGSASQTDTESGPTLASVLAAAHVPTGLDTWVAGVGDDGYVATVTPAEATVGNRPLLISTVENGTPLAQPRLVTDGDVKGGRYVSGLVDLVVGQG
jgi:hypothetical protein